MDAPRIESFRSGQIVIDGRFHSRDVIILPERVLGGWWRKEGHALHPEDLEAVFEAAPDTLIVGQGVYGRMRVTSETRQALRAAGIELVALPTGEACETYNTMREEGAGAVAAALHLGDGTADYEDVHHGLQRRVRVVMEDVTGCDLSGAVPGIDGCGLPNWPLPLENLAVGFARIVEHHALQWVSQGVGGVPAQVLIGEEDDLGPLRESPLQNEPGVAAGAARTAVLAAKGLEKTLLPFEDQIWTLCTFLS